MPLKPGTQVLVPAGVCNAFQSVSEEGTQYVYCFTDEWRPGMAGIAFSPLDEGARGRVADRRSTSTTARRSPRKMLGAEVLGVDDGLLTQPTGTRSARAYARLGHRHPQYERRLGTDHAVDQFEVAGHEVRPVRRRARSSR